MSKFYSSEQVLEELVKRLTDEALTFITTLHQDSSWDEVEAKWFNDHKYSMFDSDFIPKQYKK